MNRLLRSAALPAFALALGLSLTLFAADPAPATQSTSSGTTSAASQKSATLPAFVDAYQPLTHTDAAGKTFRYRLYVPKAAKDPNFKEKLPLVLYLHGSGGSGDNNSGQLTDGGFTAAKLLVSDATQKDYPCFVLAPQCPKKQSWGGVDFKDQKITPINQSSETLQLTLELLAAITQKYPVDSSRLYITGISLGGFGTWQAITESPDTFAAAIPICGGAVDSIAPLLANSKIPVWNFHGAKDSTVAPGLSRQIVKALQEAKADIKYTEYPDAPHNSWSRAYAEKDLLPWLFRHRKKTPPPASRP